MSLDSYLMMERDSACEILCPLGSMRQWRNSRNLLMLSAVYQLQSPLDFMTYFTSRNRKLQCTYIEQFNKLFLVGRPCISTSFIICSCYSQVCISA